MFKYACILMRKSGSKLSKSQRKLKYLNNVKRSRKIAALIIIYKRQESIVIYT